MDYTELTLAGIDMKELLDRLMQNAGLVKMLLGKFLEDGNYAALLAAVEQGDAKAAEIASHTLKGMCGNLSLKKLFDLFSEQTNLIRSGKFDEAAAMMPEISADFESAASHIKAWIAAQ